jgi:hypothetical protein
MNISALIHLRPVSADYSKTSRCLILIAVVLLGFAAVEAQIMRLTMASEPGDAIGSGQNYDLSSPTSLFMSADDRNLDNVVDNLRIMMNFQGIYWWADFAAGGPGRNLTAGGIYDDAERYPFQSYPHPGLEVGGGGSGIGCNTIAGSFVVHEAEFTGNSANGFTVVRFSASFEQHCEGRTAALYGAVFYNSDYAGPVTAINGRVVDFAGRPAANLPIILNGTQALTTTTGADGYYSFPELIANGNYRIAPAAGDYTALPSSQLFRRSLRPQTADFTIVNNYRVTGRVVDSFGDPLAGYTLTLSGLSPGRQTTTDSLGRYSFEGIPASAVVTIQPLRWYVRFIPENRTVSMALGDQTADFVGVNIARRRFDFDGDRREDIGVWRPETATWHIWRSGSSTYATTKFGLSDDRIVPEDYDGDGYSDFAVFRAGTWYVMNNWGTVTIAQFGLPGDIPVPADYDGDGRADIAVYRPSNGVWYIRRSRDGFTSFEFGTATDKAVPADYDGDGKADPALYRSESGNWILRRSRLGEASVAFGIPTDQPVPADYDGDGRVDVAVYRDGVWYVLGANGSVSIMQFGLAGDVPVPADYDGDAQADYAVYRGGTWYLLQSRSGFGVARFGLAGDTPLPAALSAAPVKRP